MKKLGKYVSFFKTKMLLEIYFKGRKFDYTNSLIINICIYDFFSKVMTYENF